MSEANPPVKQRETRVSYLEMRHRPDPATQFALHAGTRLMHAIRPTISYYRYLYDTVGQAWNWTERRLMSDTTLAAIVQDPQVRIHVLYVDGVPAGFVELDHRQAPEVELAYFGLIPEFIGRGLGPVLLHQAIDLAWSGPCERLWLHTCTLDHPGALAVYRKAGFVLYQETTEWVADLSVGDPPSA